MHSIEKIKYIKYLFYASGGKHHTEGGHGDLPQMKHTSIKLFYFENGGEKEHFIQCLMQQISYRNSSY
jgi:hypothetical protein